MKKKRHNLPPAAKIRPFLKRIDAFLFPPLCIICDQPRPAHDRWLCTSCLSALTAAVSSRKSCPRCSQNPDKRECACELSWEFPFDRIVSLLDYNDALRIIMHEIKYRGKRTLARYMGTFLSKQLPSLFFSSYDIAIPVPLHWLRRRNRGYNQAEWFARGLLEGTGRPQLKTGILRRTRRTRTQTQLDRSERRENIAGAFAVTGEGKSAIKGKSLLLIDDVITTGATTSAAASVLLKEGCESVTVLSLARD